MQCDKGPLFAWLSAWLTTTEMGVLGGTSLQGNAYPRLSKLGRWRVSELAPTSVWLVGVREGFKNSIYLALSLPERAPSDAHPSSTLSKVSKSSNCCLYVGLRGVGRAYQSSTSRNLAPLTMLQLFLISSPINLQSSML